MSTIIASRSDTHPLLRHLPATPLIEAVRRAGLSLLSYPEGVQRAYYRAQRRGFLTAAAADELAVDLLGEHPALVWGSCWWDLPEPASTEGPEPRMPAASAPAPTEEVIITDELAAEFRAARRTRGRR